MDVGEAAYRSNSNLGLARLDRVKKPPLRDLEYLYAAFDTMDTYGKTAVIWQELWESEPDLMRKVGFDPADGTIAPRTAEDAQDYQFVRLLDSRYRLRFGKEADTLPAFEGLRMIECLLWQPGVVFDLRGINLMLHGGERATGEAEFEEGRDEVRARRPNPGRPTRVNREQVREQLEDFRLRAKEARRQGDIEAAEEFDEHAQRGEEYLRRLEEPERDTDLEKIRKKLVKNLRTAVGKLAQAGLKKMASHLGAQVSVRAEGCVYQALPLIEWQLAAWRSEAKGAGRVSRK